MLYKKNVFRIYVNKKRVYILYYINYVQQTLVPNNYSCDGTNHTNSCNYYILSINKNITWFSSGLIARPIRQQVVVKIV